MPTSVHWPADLASQQNTKSNKLYSINLVIVVLSVFINVHFVRCRYSFNNLGKGVARSEELI